MNRRDFLRLSATAGIGALGLGLYTFEIEPHWVTVVERDLPVSGLPPGLDGTRAVQISDLHVGPKVSDDYLVDCLNKVAALQPDLLVFTGDFLTYSHPRGDAQFGQLRDVLAHFPQGRLATLGILGNHDYGRAWSEPAVAEKVTAVAERAGVRVLRNACATVAGLDVVGVDDLGVDGHRGHLAAALHRDLHQTATGLTVHLRVGERLLRLHELLLHLLSLREQCGHIGLATGLHACPLAC